MTLVDENYVIIFGRHEGKTIKAVMDIEPSYIGWMIKKGVIDMCLRIKWTALMAVRRQMRVNEAKLHSRHDDWEERDVTK